MLGRASSLAQVPGALQPSRRPLTSRAPHNRDSCVDVVDVDLFLSWGGGAAPVADARVTSFPVQPRPTSHHRYSCAPAVLRALGSRPLSLVAGRSASPLRPDARRQGTTFAPPPAFCDCDLAAAGQISFAPCPWIARQGTDCFWAWRLESESPLTPGRHDPVRPPPLRAPCIVVLRT
jgi:hypothetical protein